MQGKLPRGHWLVVYTSADTQSTFFVKKLNSLFVKSDNQHLCSVEESVSNRLKFSSHKTVFYGLLGAGSFVISHYTVSAHISLLLSLFLTAFYI